MTVPTTATATTRMQRSYSVFELLLRSAQTVLGIVTIALSLVLLAGVSHTPATSPIIIPSSSLSFASLSSTGIHPGVFYVSLAALAYATILSGFACLDLVYSHSLMAFFTRWGGSRLKCLCVFGPVVLDTILMVIWAGMTTLFVVHLCFNTRGGSACAGDPAGKCGGVSYAALGASAFENFLCFWALICSAGRVEEDCDLEQGKDGHGESIV